MIAIDTNILVHVDRETSALHETALRVVRLLTEDRDFARFRSLKPCTLEAFLAR